MADEQARDDVVPRWEKLRGRRKGDDDIAPPGHLGRGRARPTPGVRGRSGPSTAEPPEEAGKRATQVAGTGLVELDARLDDLRAHVEAVLSRQITLVRDELSSTVAELDRRAMSEEALDAVRAQVAAVPEGLAQAAEAAAAGRDAVARLDVVERDLSGRLAALEERVGPGLQRFAHGVETRLGELVTAADLDAVRADVGARIAEALGRVDLAALRSDMRAELTEELAAVRGEVANAATALSALEHDVRGELARLAESVRASAGRSVSPEDVAEKVAGVRDEAVAAAEARAAAAEAELSAGLDRIREALARAALGAATSHDALRRLDVVERDVSGRLAALDERVGPELQRVAQTVEARQAELVTAADLEAVRADVIGRVKDALMTLEGELFTQADVVALREEMTELRQQVAAVKTQAGEDARARVDAADRELSRRLDRMAAQIEEAQAASTRLAARVPRLRIGLGTPSESSNEGDAVAALRSELDSVQRKIDVLDGTVSGAEEQLAERLDDLASWVVAEATKKATRASAGANALAPVRSDLQALHEQVQQLSGALAALQQRVPAARRKSEAPARTAGPVTKAATKQATASKKAPSVESLRPRRPG